MNDPYSIVEWTMMKNVVKVLSLNLWWKYDEWCVEECCFIDCWMKYEMSWSCVEVVLNLSLTCHDV